MNLTFVALQYAVLGNPKASLAAFGDLRAAVDGLARGQRVFALQVTQRTPLEQP